MDKEKLTGIQENRKLTCIACKETHRNVNHRCKEFNTILRDTQSNLAHKMKIANRIRRPVLNIWDIINRNPKEKL